MTDNKAKINLILGFHAHIPHGSPEPEFEGVCKKNLKPFVSTLYKYPRIQAALHCSGTLLYWVERNYPELFMLIEDMVSRRQVELLGGGFYEPILPLLPLQDKIGQIELLTTYLRKHFGKRPQGCWIPAQTWEQNLIAPLVACGMGYTFLSEDQFRDNGIEARDMYSPCLSEEQGKVIAVFPVFRSIENKLAQTSAQTVFRELWERLPHEGEHVVSVFPRSVYTCDDEAADYAWNRFFEEISLSEMIVECVTPSKVIKGHKKFKKACFPVSQAQGNISPRRYLIACPEANSIYSKMIFTNMLINQLRGDKARKQNAREEMWKAQGCDLFSSPEYLYCHSLRKAAYRALLGAERITREKTKFVSSLIQYDFDFDGAAEFLFQDQKLNCYTQTMGAGIFELDYMPKAWNYLDTCNFYGPPVSDNALPAAFLKQTETAGRLISFADSFLPPGTDSEAFLDGNIKTGRLCAGKQYAVTDHDKVKGKVVFSLAPEEGVPFGDIEITKTFSLKKDTLSVSYTLCNHGADNIEFQFAPCVDLSFPGDGEGFVRIYARKTGSQETPVSLPLTYNADGLRILDIKNEAIVVFSSSHTFDVCIKPRYIKSGEKALYQSTAFLPVFTITLAAEESWTNDFSLKFTY